MNSLLTSYTYDEIDQLKTENSSTLSNTYNYDNNGNRTSRISNAGTDTYTYDFADKLTGITRSYAANSIYNYDGCGRPTYITGVGARTFNWDYEDRLTSISGAGIPSTTYGYNGVGARTSKSNTLGSRAYKRNGVGVTAPVLSDGVATMVPGISEKSGGVTSTILSDRMGSMKRLTNAGAVTDTAEFDAFGKVMSRTGTNATQNGFVGAAGYQEDGESGYKLLGHRYYDPETGRFLSRDPIRSGPNWYSYCANNPLKYIDATGLEITLERGEGWTDEEWHEVKVQYDQIKKTKRGKELAKENGNIIVHKGSGPGGIGSASRVTGKGTAIIWIDPATKDYWIMTTKGFLHATVVRILAHEIGHIVGGDKDDGENDLNNVKKNENPIMKEMGYPERTEYAPYTKEDVGEYFGKIMRWIRWY